MEHMRLAEELRARLAAAETDAEEPGSRLGRIGFVHAPAPLTLLGDQCGATDGLMLGLAIDLEVGIAYRRRPDGVVRLFEAGGPAVEFAISSRSDPGPASSETAFVVSAVAQCLTDAGLPTSGFDAFVDAASPRAAGLAWRAPLEMAAAHALLAGERLVSAPALAALIQRAERDYAALDGPIAEPLLSAIGRAGEAVVLDCRSLEYSHAALPADVAVAILRVGGGPGDPADAAAQRVRREAECSRAVGLIAEHMPAVSSLRDLDGRSLPATKRFLPAALARRVEHVVTENERVLEAESALEQGDSTRLGQILAASHRSLRRNYGVGSEAQDVVRDIAARTRGVVGARMLAAGDDSVFALVESDRLEPVLERFRREIGKRLAGKLSIAVGAAGEGAGQLDLFTPANPLSIDASRSY